MHVPGNIYLFKVNSRNTQKKVKNVFKVNNREIRTTSFCFFIVNFEDISHLFLVFLLLTLTTYLLAGELSWFSDDTRENTMALQPLVDFIIVDFEH